MFNARASANNFGKAELKEAIRYAKLRNVKVDFTLNTLLKNNEFSDAIELARYVYGLGADSIIVQDLGLAKYLINNFPDIDIHASTQMTIHNLAGVLELQELGFKRVVLSRELSIPEITYISNNSDIELECFIHGALCISYSGQCLLSSMIGSRSGNRGKCAQACRLPYELVSCNFNNNEEVLDKGYLLSPRDLCGLKYIPDLISSGIKCLKIEGRMKTPEYVYTVTKIYRKYIDLALSNEDYIVDEADVKTLMQVFNRGGFSSGNFEDEANLSYIYKDKPNNMGLYTGNISYFNQNKGLITFKTIEPLSIGDNICVEHEDHKYTISELMIQNNNVKTANVGDTVTIGRLKGNINVGDKIYKISDNLKVKEIKELINSENKKIPLSCIVTVKKDMPITMEVNSLDKETGSYFSMSTLKTSLLSPVDAISNPIKRERIAEQINKTTDTIFEFKKINIILDDNLYVPKISVFNQLRRDCLEDLKIQAMSRFERVLDENEPNELLCRNVEVMNNSNDTKAINNKQNKSIRYSLLLNEINPDYNYDKLQNIDKIYIPIKYFMNKVYSNTLDVLKTKGQIYIYLPTIIKDNYRNIIFNNIDSFVKDYNVKGVVVTNIAAIQTISKYKDLDIVANFTFNIFNNNTIKELASLAINRIILSPELDRLTLKELSNLSSIPTEAFVYGKIPVMNTGYCFLGQSNKCYPTCTRKCTTCSSNQVSSLSNEMQDNKYYLKDRLGYNFRIVPDNLQTITTIYNSKTLSISFDDIAIDNALISILDEDVDEINKVISTVKSGNTMSGKEYTYGNFNKLV